MTEALALIERLRAEEGVHVTLTHLVAKALALGIAANPDGNGLIIARRVYARDSVDIFLQVASEDGRDLSGVKLRSVDKLPIREIARQLNERAERVRARQDQEVERSKASLARIPDRLLAPAMRLVTLLTYNLGLDLSRFGVAYDRWYSEQSLYDSGAVARAMADKTMSLWKQPAHEASDEADSIDPYRYTRRETATLTLAEDCAIGPEQPPRVIVRVPSAAALAPAAAHQRLVDHDAGQPGGQRRLAAELCQGGEGLEVAILHGVFRLLLVAQDAPGGAIEPAVVAPHQLGQGGRVVPPGAGDQGGLILGGKAGGLRSRHGDVSLGRDAGR